MFCSKCGNEINDMAAICPNCGCPTEKYPQETNVATQSVQSTSAPKIEDGEKPTLARCALVFSFLMPIVGLILGIVGVIKYKTDDLKKKCIIAIPVSIVVWIISAVVFSVVGY